MSSPFSLLSFCSLDESATFSLFCSYAAIHGRLCDVDAVVSVVHRANIKSNKKTRKTAIKTHDICSRSCGAAISALVFFISSTLSRSLPSNQPSIHHHIRNRKRKTHLATLRTKEKQHYSAETEKFSFISTNSAERFTRNIDEMTKNISFCQISFISCGALRRTP